MTHMDQGGLGMLVLTRKMGESVDIDGGTVTVTVLQVDGKQVKLGLVAPADMAVHRAEVATKIREAGEDPGVRMVRATPEQPAKPVKPAKEHPWRRGWRIWSAASERLAEEARRMRREDDAVADAEERREAAAKGIKT